MESEKRGVDGRWSMVDGRRFAAWGRKTVGAWECGSVRGFATFLFELPLSLPLPLLLSLSTVTVTHSRMQRIRKPLTLFFILFAFQVPLLILFTGCGYKPTTAYTKKVFTGKIYTDVEVYLRHPENAVLVKDALNEAIVSRFGAKIVPKQEASTLLYVRFGNVSFRPIQYDDNGYVIYYRAHVSLTIDYRSPKTSGSERVSGFYDFPIEPKAIISDALRFQAIKNGAAKALDAFVSRIARKGVVL